VATAATEALAEVGVTAWTEEDLTIVWSVVGAAATELEVVGTALDVTKAAAVELTTIATLDELAGATLLATIATDEAAATVEDEAELDPDPPTVKSIHDSYV
jgi:hypothetical protein